mgnify:FL=1
MESFKEIIAEKNEIQKDIEIQIKKVVGKCESETQLVDILLGEQQQLKKEECRLLDLYLKEIIDVETYQNKKQEIVNKLSNINGQLEQQEQKRKLKENIGEIIENAKKVVNNILTLKKFSDNVCKELVDKIIIYNSKKFDVYLKGYETPYIFDDKSNISYLPH